MRTSFVLLLLLCLACNGITDQGFTNKAEAKNQIINGLKEGKWIEYVDGQDKVTTDTNAPIYLLTFFFAQ